MKARVTEEEPGPIQQVQQGAVHSISEGTRAGLFENFVYTAYTRSASGRAHGTCYAWR